MKRFEYAVKTLPYSEMTSADHMDAWRQEYIAWLNTFGAEGWELMKLDFTPNSVMALMKREVSA